MILTNKIVKALSLCLLVFAVVACTGAKKKTDHYVSTTGLVTPLESGREMCESSCDADFDRCAGTSAAQTDVGLNGSLSDVLGAKADCQAAMRSCMGRCKAR